MTGVQTCALPIYQGSGDDIAQSMAAKSGWITDTSTTLGTVGNDQTNNNRSGFSALPGGHRFWGTFYYYKYEAYWWSSTEYNSENAFGRYMSYNYSNVGRGAYRESDGQSVRCIKD